MPRSSSTSGHSFWHRGSRLPAIAFLLGLAFSAAAALWLHQSINDNAEVQFLRSVDRVTSWVKERLEHPIFGLNGARGVYAVNQRVNRAGFRAYVESRDLPKEFPGVRGMGFIQRVMRPELPAFLAAERADNAPQFALHQLDDPSHDDLYVVKYIEPGADNTGALGLDVGSEELRRSALQLAIDSGRPAFTRGITLVQDQRKTPGALLYVPVYANGMPHNTATQRRATLIGVIYAPIVISELFHNMPEPADFELFDAPPDNPGASRIFATDNTAEASPSATHAAPADRRFSHTQTLSLPGETSASG